MDGIQKTVYLGIEILASNVLKGKYGEGDDAFQDDDDDDNLAQQFLNDMHDEVLSKMQ